MPLGAVTFLTASRPWHTGAPPLCVVPVVTPGLQAPLGGQGPASRRSDLTCAQSELGSSTRYPRSAALCVGCCGGAAPWPLQVTHQHQPDPCCHQTTQQARSSASEQRAARAPFPQAAGSWRSPPCPGGSPSPPGLALAFILGGGRSQSLDGVFLPGPQPLTCGKH